MNRILGTAVVMAGFAGLYLLSKYVLVPIVLIILS